jgi:hypothetical protein
MNKTGTATYGNLLENKEGFPWLRPPIFLGQLARNALVKKAMMDHFRCIA